MSFLALTDERRLIVVIEIIKRSGYPVPIEEPSASRKVQGAALKGAQQRDLAMVLMRGGTLDVTEGTRKTWQDRPDGQIRTWNRDQQPRSHVLPALSSRAGGEHQECRLCPERS